MQPDFVERVQAYLEGVPALQGARVVAAEAISGAGLSRCVVRLDAAINEQGQAPSYVLLLEQAGSPVEPNREAEFAILRALAGAREIKVPHAYCMEADARHLGAPFLLTEFLPGTTNPKALHKPGMLPFARRIIEASFETLGALAAFDVRRIDVAGAMASPPIDQVWRIELARWEKLLDGGDAGRLAVTRAALRRLHRWPPPPPPRLSIVHGDYRVGNYLFDTNGLTGVIDWEMVHLGDAIEDLAWSLLPNWEFTALPGRIGGFLTRDEALGAWQSTRGQPVDPAALAWWTLFCHVKAVAIWETGRRLVASGKDNSMLMGLVAYGLVEKQEAAMMAALQWPLP